MYDLIEKLYLDSHYFFLYHRRINEFMLNEITEFDGVEVHINTKIAAFEERIREKVTDNDQSVLVACLVGKSQIAEIKAKLQVLAKLIAEANSQNDWQIHYLVSESSNLALVDLFMTNSQLPQIIYLGAGIADQIHYIMLKTDAMSVEKLTSDDDLYKLYQLTYNYHFDNPVQYVKQQLINLDPKQTEQQMLKTFSKVYVNALKAEIETQASLFGDYFMDGEIGFLTVDSIHPFTLNDLLSAVQSDTEVVKGNKIKEHAEYQPIIEYLSKLMNN